MLAAAVVLFSAACDRPEHTVTDTARGVRFVVPAGWRSYDAEIRSPQGSLMTLRVYDLVEANKRFVAGLPDSLIPQLLEWAELYYIVEGEPTRTATTVAGLPATELVYSVRARKKDPPSKLIYWIVIRKTRLFVFRAGFAAEGLPIDEPVVRRVVDGWVFLGSTDETGN
jgi:hypothetical protein